MTISTSPSPLGDATMVKPRRSLLNRRALKYPLRAPPGKTVGHFPGPIQREDRQIQGICLLSPLIFSYSEQNAVSRKTSLARSRYLPASNAAGFDSDRGRSRTRALSSGELLPPLPFRKHSLVRLMNSNPGVREHNPHSFQKLLSAQAKGSRTRPNRRQRSLQGH